MSLQQPSGIVTPEAVLLEFDTAGVGSRTAAVLLDVLIQVSILGLLSLAAFFLAGAVGGGAGTVALIIMLVMVLVVIVGYPLAMESLWGGRTLGKAALGLRVVTVEGGPVRVRQSATRAIIGVFELWATFGSVAVLATILTRDNQRLGDLLAGTLVLRERAAMATAATAMSFPAPYGYADYVASIDVSVLTNDQYGVIRTFLMRVLDLTVEARGALAVKLANATALQLHHTPPANLPPELFLVCVASAYQARHGGVVPAATGGGSQPRPLPGVVSGPYAGYGAQPGHPPPPPGFSPPAGY
ncbi:MAG: RDD family protein, partial [Acidimicrobiales bacterium]